MHLRRGWEQYYRISTKFPEGPWTKVGADLFQWKEDQYLLVTDYLSWFVEITILSSTTAASVVTHLKSMFAHHGILTELSNNGPQFTYVIRMKEEKRCK